MKQIHYTSRYLFTGAIIGWLMLNSVVSSAADSVNLAARKSPDWLRRSVIYEIFPRDFSQAGNFNAITARMDELKDFGVDVLWLMPVHPVGEKMKKGSVGSPYAVRDFYAINPDYGSTNDFRRLIESAHQRHMKVMMDIVAGQTSWDSVLMAQPDFYLHGSNGEIIPPDPAWTDVAGLNYGNPAVRQYMIGMMEYWMKDFGVDGFRCDVAPNVPLSFWEAARAALEKINPEVIMLADAGSQPALLAKAFDIDSSWGMVGMLNNVISKGMPASDMRAEWQYESERFPKDALHLRFTDNHEEIRALVRYGVDGALAGQVLMMTLDGVPLFYNGMEVGDATESADPALFEKMPIFWNPGGRPPLRAIYHDLIQLRKDHAAFYNGDVVWLDNNAAGEVVSFLRRDKDDEFLVLINLSGCRASGTIQLADTRGFNLVKINSQVTPIDIHLPDFNLAGYGWYIFHRAAPK